MTYPIPPDVEDELVAWLTAHTALAALHGGRVATELRTDLVCLQVTTLGGPQPWPWEETPEFAINSWGGDKGEAKTLDRTLRAAVWELVGAPIAAGRITGLAVRLASLWTPDETTGRARYRTDIALTVSPEGT